MMYLPGDIFVINLPFSDAQGSKKRPVLVIRDTEDGDLLVAKITSRFYETSFDILLQHWTQANLVSPSTVRIHKLQTIHTSLIFGMIGRLHQVDRKLVKERFIQLIQSLR